MILKKSGYAGNKFHRIPFACNRVVVIGAKLFCRYRGVCIEFGKRVGIGIYGVIRANGRFGDGSVNKAAIFQNLILTFLKTGKFFVFGLNGIFERRMRTGVFTEDFNTFVACHKTNEVIAGGFCFRIGRNVNTVRSAERVNYRTGFSYRFNLRVGKVCIGRFDFGVGFTVVDSGNQSNKQVFVFFFGSGRAGKAKFNAEFAYDGSGQELNVLGDAAVSGRQRISVSIQSPLGINTAAPRKKSCCAGVCWKPSEPFTL